MNLLKSCFLLPVLIHQLHGQPVHFKNIPIDTNYSLRGLSVVDDSVAWVSGIKGVVGKSTNGENNWTFAQVKGFEKSDFRSLYAFNANEAVIANAGSPANILRTKDGGKSWEIVYTNNDSLAFFDGVDFWNDKEGIIYGDPIKGRMLLLKTIDGGKTWQELPEESRPEMAEGEASFAASGTGIRCHGRSKVIIATGGKVSKLLVSNDYGIRWEPVKTPILQGKSSTGIFSVAYTENDSLGDWRPKIIVVGGDYTNDTLKKNHVLYATHLTATGILFREPARPTGGYRECVEFLGGSHLAIAVGPGGTDITKDGGILWDSVGQKGFHVIRKARKGKLVIAAGSKRISVVSP